MGSMLRNSRTIERESIEDQEAKKVQKRAQLRHLLLNKFKNKYLVLNRVRDPELAYQIITHIEQELEKLFGLNQF
jgi:hypothetical protein